jgi:hypothetical protein
MTDTTNKAKVIEELPAMASIVKADLLVVHDVSANITSKANLSLLIKSLVVGPYANDAVAAAANVAVSELYYNANGVVFVRST